jgi:UDP-N-acetylglucosamine diphosphorylase / glucose-1-phosphate thymidylyltransferase / UDP-N-acetylgalactosamine diphosphorylase / glucosamine-1-phosphate N-acetyltransferase / galactosamine-1-phosphate N-acetyltransferase
MRVCLFEDSQVLGLEPLTLTRPAFDLLCGQSSLADKQYAFFSPTARGMLVRPHLADVVRPQTRARVNDFAWLRAGPSVLVNGRWLPPHLEARGPGRRAESPLTPHVGLSGDEVAYAVLSPAHLAGCDADRLDDCLERWKSALPHRQAGGRLVRHLWELVQRNGEQITLDWLHGEKHRPHPPAVALVGPADRLVVDPTARVDPLVVADTTGGPVVIDRGAVIHPFTRLEGPCYVGPRTQVCGAKVRAGTTLGPDCRVGGEVEASIVQGHSNKYHDGFLGHAYVGEWVNLGAGTSNSDLRNDYGNVSVTVAGRRVDTGRPKVGCFLGDHTKTGLGTLLNTGTSAGAFCNLLPSSGLLPKYVPSFCRVRDGALVEDTDLPALLETARKVMGRRDRALTDAHAELYRALLHQTAPERQRALHESELRRLRRSA